MELRAGTSGFSYKQWRGPFYPADAAPADFLRFYAERLPTVEINNTFYRMPRAEVMAAWREQVPAGFTFVIKASQRITHRARLRECADAVAYLWSAIGALGDRLGPVLFQLPPTLKVDVDRLRSFVGVLPVECRPVFEFRHPTWRDEEVYATLRERRAAWCVTDTDEEPEPPLPRVADWGYLRLRRSGYTPAELDDWAVRIREAGWRETFCFFKHEDEGAAPRLALDFAARFGD
jgi:uncharacterized protein YecE (DUF72 family)